LHRMAEEESGRLLEGSATESPKAGAVWARRTALGIVGLLFVAAMLALSHGGIHAGSRNLRPSMETMFYATRGSKSFYFKNGLKMPFKALNTELTIPGINDPAQTGIIEPRGSGVSNLRCLTRNRRRLPRPNDYEEFSAIPELDACNSKCGEQIRAGVGCTAFEYHKPSKVCRTFTRPVTGTKDGKGYTCSILGTGGDAPAITCPKGGSKETTDLPQEFPFALLSKGRCRRSQVMKTMCMTRRTYKQIRRQAFRQLRRLGTRCDATSCKQADYAGCVLRMAGHDFMDYDPSDGSGGSDGCTDMNNPDNGGLSKCLVDGEFSRSISDVYEDFCDSVSLADFLVIMAESAMEFARKNVVRQDPNATKYKPIRTFKYGRTTVKECPKAAFRLPNPENGCAAVKETFIDSLGLTQAESSALMGVHTLGRCHVENSGYSGWWSSPEQSRLFNNDYFKAIVFKGWKPMKSVCGNPDKNQWFRTGPQGGPTLQGSATEMMLNTDLCLAYSVDAQGPPGDETPIPSKGPLLAKNNTCCAWFFADPTTAPPPQEILATFTEVCHAKFTPTGEPIDDCGSVFQLEGFGLAGAAIRRWATDERAWLRTFRRVWNKATEKGQPGLKRLERNSDACDHPMR